MVCVWVFVCLLLSSDEINIDKPVSLELKLGEIEIVEENRNKSQFGDKKKTKFNSKENFGNPVLAVLAFLVGPPPRRFCNSKTVSASR